MEEEKLIPADLSVVSEEIIDVLLLDSTVEPSLFEEIAQENTHRPEILKYLLNHSRTPDKIRQFVARILQVPVPGEPTNEAPAEEEAREYRMQNMYQRIQKMKVGEKIQLALRGSREIRSILIRDSSKEVMLMVLENPKITESEIELLSKQRTSPDEVLRTIAKNREWMRKYSIVLGLVNNPKTPVPIAISYMRSLKQKDLVMIEKNRNISEAVRAAAKKILAAKRR